MCRGKSSFRGAGRGRSGSGPAGRPWPYRLRLERLEDRIAPASADLAVFITPPATVIAGTNLTYAITVLNNGPDDAQAVSLSDLLPVTETFVSQSETGSDVFSLSNTGNQMSDTIATLPSGHSDTFTVTAFTNPNLAAGTQISDTASISSSTPDPNLSNNSISTTTTVGTSADLAVTMIAPPTVLAGASLTYTITVTNNGPSDAQSAALTDFLPGGETFVSQSQTAGTDPFTLQSDVLGGQNISDTVATLPSGHSDTFTVTASVAFLPAGTLLSNTASVGSSTPDPNTGNNSSTVTTTVNPSADLVVTTTAPSAGIAGTNVTYTITVSNNGSSDAQSVSLSDFLPAGETFVSQSQTSGTDPFVLSNNGNQITDTITALPLFHTDVFTYTARLNANLALGAQLTDTASTSSSTSDPNTSNNSSTVTTTVGSTQADLAVSLIAPPTVVAGTNLTYTITLTNNGPSDAQNVALGIALGNSETFVSESQTVGTDPFIFSNNGTSFPDTIATLPSGHSDTFTVTAAVNLFSANGLQLSNSAGVNSSTVDPNTSNNSASASTTVIAPADIAVTQMGPPTAVAGTTLTYSIMVANLGPGDAQSVSLSDLLPAGETFVSQSRTAGVDPFVLINNGNQISDTIATLPNGHSDTFTVTAKLNANLFLNTQLINTASAGSNTPDLNISNNSAHVTTTITGTSADLAISKTSAATVIAGANLTYTITVSNNGPSDAQAVSLSDLLPATETFVSQSQSGSDTFTLSHTGNQVSDTIATLPSGHSDSFTVTATVVANLVDGTQISNTASVSSSTPDPNPSNNSSTSTTTVKTPADLAVTKTGPAAVVAGAPMAYTITVTNNGPSDAQAVSLSDLLPSTETFVSQSQAGSDVFSLSNSSNQVSDTIATLPSGHSDTFTVTATVNASVGNGTQVSNTATVSSSTPDPNPSNNASTFTTTVSGTSADLVVTKTGAATAVAGTNLTYTITVSNNGPSDAQNVSLSDVLPTTEAFVSQSQAGSDLFSLNNTGNQVSDTIATLPSGHSDTFTVTASVNASVGNGTQISNTATVSSSTPDPNLSNNSSTFTTTVSGTSADLVVTKTGAATAVAGTNLTYTITVSNNGPSDAQAVSLSDLLPTTETFVSQSQTNGSDVFSLGNTGNQVGDTIATLPSGHSDTFTVTATVKANVANGTQISNTASVSSTTPDPNPSNNSATFTTTVSGTSADLAVTKSGASAVVAGTNLTYTITVSNNGPSDAQAVSLSDLLPTTEAFVSQSQAGSDVFSLNNTGNQVSDTIATLPSGHSDTFTVTATVKASVGNGTQISNTASVSSTTPDPNPSNNSATFTTTVSGTSADLAVTKSGASAVVAGTNLTYMITVSNNGPSDAQAVSLSDLLPTTEAFVSQSQTNGSDVFSLGNTGNQVGDTIATLPSGHSDTFTVTATVKANVANGTQISNTASVSSSTPDPNLSNNSSTFTTTVSGTSADLVVTKTGAATAVAGTNLTYTITVSNNGPSDAQAVSLSDVLPTTEAFVSQSQAGSDLFSLNNSGNQISDTIATLPSGHSDTFTVTATVKANVANGTQISNTASVSSSTPDPNLSNNSSTFATTVSSTAADLAVIKSGASAVVPGANLTYTITVTNNGPNDAQAVSLSDLLPSTETFVSQSQTTGSDAFSLSNTGNQVSDTIATLPNGHSDTFTVTATVKANVTNGTQISNTATVSSSTPDPNLSNNSSAFTTTVSSTAADLAVTKTGPAAAIAGTNLTYTITVTNNGLGDAQNVSLSDLLPNTETFVSQSQTAGSDAFFLTHTSNQVSDTIAILPSGHSDTFTVTATVKSNVPSGTQISNTAFVSSATPDPSPSNNFSTTNTTISTSADLAVVKTGPATVAPGANLTYAITVTNNGPSDAQGVSLSDLLPSTETFVSQSQTAGADLFALSRSGIHISDTITTLPSGHSDTIMVTVTVKSDVANGTQISNTASVSSSTPDPNSSNNSYTATTMVKPSSGPLLPPKAIRYTRSSTAQALAGPLATTLGYPPEGSYAAANMRVLNEVQAAAFYVNLVGGQKPPRVDTATDVPARALSVAALQQAASHEDVAAQLTASDEFFARSWSCSEQGLLDCLPQFI
jgi:uncharacterized repeat protein (TIGR01451 family)